MVLRDEDDLKETEHHRRVARSALLSCVRVNSPLMFQILPSWPGSLLKVNLISMFKAVTPTGSSFPPTHVIISRFEV